MDTSATSNSWRCGKCGYLNPAWLKFCLKCGKPKPANPYLFEPNDAATSLERG